MKSGESGYDVDDQSVSHESAHEDDTVDDDDDGEDIVRQDLLGVIVLTAIAVITEQALGKVGKITKNILDDNRFLILNHLVLLVVKSGGANFYPFLLIYSSLKLVPPRLLQESPHPHYHIGMDGTLPNPNQDISISLSLVLRRSELGLGLHTFNKNLLFSPPWSRVKWGQDFFPRCMVIKKINKVSILKFSNNWKFLMPLD